ncbi:MAG: metallophosphoesterase [Chitinophagaceae bacterium]|nr:metallophosphoesterase [Chitinophagaceae bacterium]
MSQLPNSPFVRTSNPHLSRWQSVVMDKVCERIQKENPGMEIHEVRALALRDPMVIGVHLHVEEHNENQKSSADDAVGKAETAATAAPPADSTDTPLHIKHYQASKEFYAFMAKQMQPDGQRPINKDTGEPVMFIPDPGPDDKPRTFPDTDSNYAAWAVAGTEWTNFANPLPSPYVDWRTQVPPHVNPNSFVSTFNVFTIKDNAKVVILGDYGTGLTDGIIMLMSILVNQKPDYIIHIGDVYYSGTGSETAAYVNMFTQAFKATGMKVPVFSIPGNHEYMSGGAPFFEQVLQMNKNNGFPQYAQTASYFCLRNESNTIQFLSMDTGVNSVNAYLPNGLTAAYSPWLWYSEMEWIWDKLNSFKNGKTILLSHHQLFSVSGVINDGNNVVWVAPGSGMDKLQFMNGNLYNALSPYFGQVAAWFWGHEHLLCIYQDGQLGLKKGRLIGNSGYEQWDKDGGYTPLTNKFKYGTFAQLDITRVQWWTQYSPVKFHNQTSFYNHGWAYLGITGGNVHASYWQFPVMDPDITTLPPVGQLAEPLPFNFSEDF